MKRVKIVFVMAIHHPAELEHFQRLLDNWDRLIDAPFEFSILFSTKAGMVPRTDFPHSVLEWQDDPARSNQTNVSLEWAAIAKHIHEQVDCTCWFWWEWDVFPVRRDCFSYFLSKWMAATKLMGYLVKDRRYGMKNKVNGVAFYARDFCTLVEVAKIAPGLNFDHLRSYSAADIKSGLLVPLNDAYCLRHHELRTVISGETRLVHGERGAPFFDRVLSGALHQDLVPERARKFHVWSVIAKGEARNLVKQTLLLLRLRKA